MNQRLTILLRISFAFLDLLVLNVAFLICEYMFQAHISADDKVQYTYFWFLCNIAWIIASWGTNIYNDKYIYSFEKFSRSTMQAFAYFLAPPMLYLPFNKDADLSPLSL